MTTFTWNTRKTASGTFEAVVSKFESRSTPNAQGLYADTVEIKRIPCKTRAIAKTHAQKWVRYLKANSEAA